MATTTLTDIIQNYRAVIEALTPTRLIQHPFRRTTRRHVIEELIVANPGSGMLRQFEIRSPLAAAPSAILDPGQGLMIEPLELIVAYPALVAMYGRDDLDAMEEVIRRDARQLHDAILSPGNYISGQNGGIPEFGSVDRSLDVWLYRLPFTVHFWEAQTFT